MRIRTRSPIAGAACSLGVMLMLVAACDKPRKLGTEFLESGKKEYSEHDEEKIIRHFFDDARNGFYLDVGCAEWEMGSTTLYLEKNLDWKGIAIDARSEVAEGWAKNRPGAKFFSYIVTDHSGTKDTFYKAGGISSTKREHTMSFPLPEGFAPEEIEVPTITLNELLDQNGVKKIDFLLLDIEAGEPAALRGFDIDRFKPSLICIEIGNTDVRQFIAPYFAEHGYERIEEYVKYDKVNWYYRPVTKG